ncbi:MAG TPA: efflux RND transporter periplasmic adaptor subunit, partial [Pirellulaceae bacterium]
RGGWLPWLLFVLMSGFAGWLGFQLYVRSSSDTRMRATPESSPGELSAVNADPRGDVPRDRENGNVANRTGTDGHSPAAESPSPSDHEDPARIVLESKGYVVARRQVLVSPQVSGRLVHLDLEEGMVVEKGQILARVDATEYEADHERAEANLALAQQRLLELEAGNRPEEIAQAEAALSEAEALLPQREAEFLRLRQLYQSRASSQAEFELAESGYRTQVRRAEFLRQAVKLMKAGARHERIGAARAEVDLAVAERKKTQWRLDNCLIRAPISGTVLRKNAEEGNLVNPVAFNGSYSICEIADLSDLEVDLLIQERDIARVFVNQRCTIRVDAFPDRVYQGTVSRLMPIADRARGAVPVRAKIVVPAEEKGEYLKPELGALVTFFAGSGTT